ncbi:hypothetical protein CAOG_04179 [Capsaspora owczarzaki ATCC 30864]|uniref:Phospholipase A2 n=1 Tax=Capsaspora owczarzaki (strain ATCC 30864) TaxID=595528 RepID=A0A0D2UE42_CAPO3|nr:hypothetical protein CAOG_04179 [Capsaspora owczarzaki ATCC 30864]KJE93386.1 hypothetical protein CAOG_004179 [Capsaspora owczarzaki ATCC 30864]|eukprot:XP_004348004.1 hypothetical protein CAOG_04179 [Capsaspora owczarzaki ATCC 30864]
MRITAAPSRRSAAASSSCTVSSMPIHTLATLAALAALMVTSLVIAPVQAADDPLGNLFATLMNAGGTPGVGDGSCKHQCPSGAAPLPKQGHKPTSNGCGPASLPIRAEDMKFPFTPCCDEHDYCYHTCNSVRDTCDSDFGKCLSQVCDRVDNDQDRTACDASKDFFLFSTSGFGCSSFLASQQDACTCPGGERGIGDQSASSGRRARGSSRSSGLGSGSGSSKASRADTLERQASQETDPTKKNRLLRQARALRKEIDGEL